MPKPKPEPEPPREELHATTLRLPARVWRRIRAVAGGEGKSANEWITEQLERLTADPKQVTV